MRQGELSSAFIVRSLLPVIVMAMAEDKGTSTPKQVKEPTRRVHIPRVVVVVLLTLLIASSITVVFFAGEGIDNPAALWGIRAVAVLVVIGALWRLIRIGYEYQWTGLGEAELPKQENVEFRPKKTLWDWLQLLIIPISGVVWVVPGPMAAFGSGRRCGS